MREVTRRRARLGVVPLAALCAIALMSARCGGEATRNDGRSSGTGGVPSTGGASATGGMTSVATGGLPNGFGCPGIPSEWPASTEDSCLTQTECECVASDTYFLIERSDRMFEAWGGTTRWQYLKDALRELKTGADGGVAFSGGFEPKDGDACHPDLYAQPALVFHNDFMPGPAIVSALGAPSRAGKNPLLLAFVQLVDYLASIGGVPNRPTTIVLVTATPPDDCPSSVTVDDLARAITSSRARLRARIVTIALGADYDVDVLAQAAGALPYRIGAHEAPSRLLEAFWGCGGQQLECEGIEVPSPPPDRGIDLESLWVGFYTPRGLEAPPRLSGPEDCASSPNGGYYVDTSSASTMVRLCPCTCLLMQYCNFGLQFRCPAL